MSDLGWWLLLSLVSLFIGLMSGMNLGLTRVESDCREMGQSRIGALLIACQPLKDLPDGT